MRVAALFEALSALAALGVVVGGLTERYMTWGATENRGTHHRIVGSCPFTRDLDQTN